MQKLERITTHTYDIDTGKKVQIVKHRTATVWENCKNCKGTGVA